MHIVVLNGPNLNRLGKRPVSQYGTDTLPEIEARIKTRASELSVRVTQYQSNHEGDLIDRLYDLLDTADAVVVNPAGLTTYGKSLADALAECGVPYGVVHISQPYSHRGADMPDVFRDNSAVYVCGLGWKGYVAAIEGLADRIRSAE
ncbi:type II 3-dehydroquinate dehydratase [Herbiconiux sp. 11R-BC]|uniref:type II 3-dehydroquinate dehydratase n=1 Tax=Herbiconiux sp. 11R-BC TaxID=3111637 RepID=UPI003C0429B2